MLASGPDQQCDSVAWTPSTQSHLRSHSSPSRHTSHEPGYKPRVVSNEAHPTLRRRRVGGRGRGGVHALSRPDGGMKSIQGGRLNGRGSSGRAGAVPIGSYLSMLMGGDVRGRVNW